MKRFLNKIIFLLSIFSLALIVFAIMPLLELIFQIPKSNITERNGDNFSDVYFAPLLNAYKKWNHTESDYYQNNKTKIPSFLLVMGDEISSNFWKQQLIHINLNQCPLPCTVTSNKKMANKVNAIVFYLKHMKTRTSLLSGLPKRDPIQPWIMLSFEAALLGNQFFKTNYSVYNGMFNRTMMHRMDSDVLVSHGFIVTNSDVRYLPKDWILPPPKDYNQILMKKRMLVVAFISNCNAYSNRLEYIKEMKKYTSVDVYGKCGKLKCGTSRYAEIPYKIDTDKCYKMAANNYMFYLAFENSICKEYVTEKLYNLLYYPIVPVVLGGADYKKILPPGSYINAAEYSPEKLVKYLTFLAQNPENYKEYLSWKRYYRPSTIGGVRSMCHLCVKLYDPSFYNFKVYEDFYHWFYVESKCNRKWISGTNIL